jgi:hypothetical protein
LKIISSAIQNWKKAYPEKRNGHTTQQIHLSGLLTWVAGF